MEQSIPSLSFIFWWLPGILNIPWLVATSSPSLHPIITWCPPWESVSKFPSYKDISHWISTHTTHSSVLAWRIPGTAEPGGLPSMGSHRVGHNWSDLAAAATTREAGILPVLEYHLNSFWDVSWFYFCFLELIYFLIFPSFCSLFIQAEYIPSSPKKISLSFSFSAVFTAKKMKWSKCLILL